MEHDLLFWVDASGLVSQQWVKKERKNQIEAHLDYNCRGNGKKNLQAK
jgi:hypothetical protein